MPLVDLHTSLGSTVRGANGCVERARHLSQHFLDLYLPVRVNSGHTNRSVLLAAGESLPTV